MLIRLLIGSSKSSPNSSASSSPVISSSPFDSLKSATHKRNKAKDKETVLEILRNYSHCIDTEQALKYLPDDMNAQLLKAYIHKSFIYLSTISKENKLLRGLSTSIGQQVRILLI